MNPIPYHRDHAIAADVPQICRRAIAAEGILLAIERVISPRDTDPSGEVFDLNTLARCGAWERTEHQFQALLKHRGFDLIEIDATRSALSINVARPAPA